jgi:hypothetical protein
MQHPRTWKHQNLRQDHRGFLYEVGTLQWCDEDGLFFYR